MIRSLGPEAPGLPRLAVGTLATLLVAKLLLHLAAIGHYGYFRDELYYLASTEHLAWGYVEHPPFSIALLALVRSVLGDSLPALRLVPILSGAAVVLLTAVLARRLGGGRFAQGIAALAAVMAPAFLGTHRYYSMNALDLLFWTLASLATLQALERGRARDWSALGVLLGLGLLNKVSMAWYGGGLAIGLLATRQRRALLGTGPWLAGAIALALFAPHVVWQIQNGWPTLEFIRNATSLKMAATTPGEFLRDQILTLNPGAAPLWIAGLIYGLVALRGRPGQVLPWIYLSVLVLLLAQGHSRASYLTVAYPPLLALGGVAVERWTGATRRWVRPALAALILLTGLVAVPLALPVLPVRTFVRYQSALGMAPRTEERNAMGALPQDYADMFGWEEMAALVARAYDRLTPEERGRCLIFGQNYGEAGAIDVIGRKLGLPPAISGHNSYWLWGPRRREWEVVIIIGGDRKDNAAFFDRIEIVGQTRSEWAMPYERGLDVSIARGPKMSLAEAWPRVKQYI
ncbi:MAG TPA: glycosyltransferase family 39 protein [Candidatus Binatia bacterium]|nr:glycosyltransferase family 39 protein [Candidatus Binatia bacterium]